MKPVLLHRDQLLAAIDCIRAGLASGDTDEGSIQFTLPLMDDRRLDLPADPAEQEKWQIVQDGDEAAPLMYEPKTEYVWVRASYRIGRAMGQGGVRMIGEM